MLSAIPARVAQSARRRGVVTTGRSCASWGVRYLAGLPTAGRPARETFEFDGERLAYMRHRYNWTWLNERAVEVPLALREIERRRGGEVLEIGNVLGHYGERGHTVVDRYEHAPGVVNADVVDYDPGDRRFDLVVSVSTLEHVGLDEQPRDPGKPARAIARLVELLAPGGLLWITVPVGYNPALEDEIRSGRAGFTRVAALRNAGKGLEWEQTQAEQTRGVPYDELLYIASAVLICQLARDS
jgi:SAM-dependent methyltransferase